MDLWNVKNLAPPPINSAKTCTKEADVRLLQAVAKDAVDFYENQQHLHIEAALVSRVVYRMKMKFRSAKDFKALEKLSRALRVYLHMGVPTLFKTLLRSLPGIYRVDYTHILTKNMIDYVLVRLQGLGKLLCRILGTCKIVAELTLQRLRLGHFWKVALIILAATSRVFVVAKAVCKRTCEIFDNLVPFSASLGSAGVAWLPRGYSLPKDLEKWLEVEWLNAESRVIEISDDEPMLSYFRLIEDSEDDVEFCDECVLVNDESLVENDEKIEINYDDVDVGEIISLSDCESNPREVDTEVTSDVRKNKKRRRSLDLSDIEVVNSCNRSPKPFKINTDEFISLTSSPTPQKIRKKRKRKNKNVEVINISILESPQNTKNKCKNSPNLKVKNMSVNKVASSMLKKRKKKHKDKVSLAAATDSVLRKSKLEDKVKVRRKRKRKVE